MIKTSQQYYDRTAKVVENTKIMIKQKPFASFVPGYTKTIQILNILLDEMEVCDNMTGDELLESSNAIFNRTQELRKLLAKYPA